MKNKNWDMIRLFESINKTKVKGTLNEDSGMNSVTNDAGEPMGYETHYDDENQYGDDESPSSATESMGFDNINWREVYDVLNNNDRVNIDDLTKNDMDTTQLMGINDLSLLVHSTLGKDWGLHMEDEKVKNPSRGSGFVDSYSTITHVMFDLAGDTSKPTYEEFVNGVKHAYANPSHANPPAPDAEERYRGQF